MVVENKGNTLATDSSVDYVIINKKTGKRVADSTNRMTGIGIIGPKCKITSILSCDRIDLEGDYKIWYSFQCHERIQDPDQMEFNIIKKV